MSAEAYWKGVPLTDMTKDELIEALLLMGSIHREQAEQYSKNLAILAGNRRRI